MPVAAQENPKAMARVAGLFYLLVVIMAPLAVSVLVHFHALGDPAAIVNGIAAHKTLFRLGFLADLLSGACYLVVTALLYRLFRPVNKALALVATYFSVTGVAVGAVSLLFRMAPLTILENTDVLSAFSATQLQALVMLCLRLRTLTEHIGIVFFGFYCVLIGILIFRSSFFPRLLGAGMTLAGIGWLLFLYAPLAEAASPVAQILSGVGEISFTLYLLIAGVNEERWHQQASLAASG